MYAIIAVKITCVCKVNAHIPTFMPLFMPKNKRANLATPSIRPISSNLLNGIGGRFVKNTKGKATNKNRKHPNVKGDIPLIVNLITTKLKAQLREINRTRTISLKGSGSIF